MTVSNIYDGALLLKQVLWHRYFSFFLLLRCLANALLRFTVAGTCALVKEFFCDFCKIFKSTFFKRTPPLTASFISGTLILFKNFLTKCPETMCIIILQEYFSFKIFLLFSYNFLYL